MRHPKKLLFRAAKHAALSELDKKVHKTTDFIEDMMFSSDIADDADLSAEDIVSSKRKFAHFSMAVAGLPPVCRKVFLLRKFEGLSAKEVAARLNISVSMVDKHLATGLLKCNRKMREFGYAPHDFGAPNGQDETRVIRNLAERGERRSYDKGS